ncbi:MAG: hypothetical protein ACR2FO_02200 [Actinomycetota bacterium]
MTKTLQSLDIVAEQVRAVRSEQLKHFESLDTKAGVILGSAGATIALVGQLSGAERYIGSGLALVAALAALLAFVPRDFPVIQPRQLRDRYFGDFLGVDFE